MSASNLIICALENHTLTGVNFEKWKSNINVVLVSENIKFVLTQQCPPRPQANCTCMVTEHYDRWVQSNNRVKAYMLASMSSSLRSLHEPMETASEIMKSLYRMFGKNSEEARHEATMKFFTAKMSSDTYVRDHVMKMTNYLFDAEILGAAVDEVTQVGIILNSLPKEFASFTNAYAANKSSYGITRLLNELQTYEYICELPRKMFQANVATEYQCSKKHKREISNSEEQGGSPKKPRIELICIKAKKKKPKVKCYLPVKRNLVHEKIPTLLAQPVRWVPPMPGCIKINTDGAVRARTTGASSCGGVFRDYRGIIVSAFSSFLGNNNVTALEAEMKAVVVAIDAAYSTGFPRVWLECDSLQTVTFMNNRVADERIPKLVREEWGTSLKKAASMDIVVSHIYREGNTVAHKLADHAIHTKMPFMVWNEAPEFVLEEAYLDAIGHTYLRMPQPVKQ